MLLEAKTIQKIYSRGTEKVSALKGVDLSIQRGDFTCIMGPSGSGKSTLLQIIGGLDRPTSGHILFEGQAIDSYSDSELSRFRRQKLGFIFQFFHLLPTMSAVENVALPMLLDGVSMAKVRPRAIELLTWMGLEGRIHHRSDQLSGGEMQRVAIARALVSNPLLVFADEPTGNLDTKSGTNVLELLSKIVKEQNVTLVMVTHDPKASSYANRVVNLRDGAIESDVRH